MDPYRVLGIPRDADTAAIRQAFRRRAAELHPDQNKDPAAEETSKMVSAAYALLYDKEKRRIYDAGQSDIFGNPRRRAAPAPRPRYEPPPPRYNRPPAPPPPPPPETPFDRWRKENEERSRRMGDWAKNMEDRREVFDSFSGVRDQYWKAREEAGGLNLFAEQGKDMAAKAAEKALSIFSLLVRFTDEVAVYGVSNDRLLQDSVASMLKIIGSDQGRFLYQLSALHTHMDFFDILEMHESMRKEAVPDSDEARAFVEKTTATGAQYLETAIMKVRLKRSFGDAEQRLIEKSEGSSPIKEVAERLLVVLRARRKEMWV